MTDKTMWEVIKTEGGSVMDRLHELIHQGNVRRVVIEHQGRIVAEFPLTAGVVGSVLAPPLAAIGAIYALAKECTIKIERTDTAAKAGAAGPTVATTAADHQTTARAARG
jgi:hypothetical protein